VYENRVLRKWEWDGSKWQQAWEELQNLYVPPHVISVIKSRNMRWLGHVACIGEVRNTYKILVRKLREEDTTWKTYA
jgi:hypothetical protein